MAKASITTKKGTKVTVEGTHEEVAALIMRFEGSSEPASQAPAQTRARRQNRSKPSLVGLISDLISGGFFEKPKELSAVKRALEEQGHFYPVTTLSPIMLRLVRRRDLRRIKDNKRWSYVG